jgi:curli biogenesis system outer membrane secretion channel CsgG
MNRIVILAAAAALIALPASAQSIRVSTEGKSAQQVRTEVYQAARKVCADQVPGYSYRIDEARACLSQTVRATLAQSHDPNVRVASR